MRVRSAAISDAADLARIHIETWQVAYAEVFPEEFLQGLDLEARVTWFERNITNGRDILVAEGEGVVGFSFFGDSRDDDWGELYAIYVHPDHWDAGYGRILLEASEVGLAASGHERALLWVLEPNSRAREFYERQGWTLGKPVKLEEIGSTQVTEVRYEKDLRAGT